MAFAVLVIYARSAKKKKNTNKKPHKKQNSKKIFCWLRFSLIMSLGDKTHCRTHKNILFYNENL